MSDQSSEPTRDHPGAVAEPGSPVGVLEPAGELSADVGLGDAEQIAAELAAVDRALARIEAGDYGNCTECGTRLDDAHLAADPTATTCQAHLGLEHATPEPADVTATTATTDSEPPLDDDPGIDTGSPGATEPPVDQAPSD